MMKPRRIIEITINIFGILGGFSVIVMFLLTSIDVICRYLFNMPLLWAYEITEYLMVTCIYLGLAYTDKIGGHIRIDFLLSRFSYKMQKIIEVVNHLFMIAFMTLLTRQSWIIFTDTIRLGKRHMGAAHTPMAPSHFIFFIGSFIFSIHLLMKTVDIIIRRPAKITESEKERE